MAFNKNLNRNGKTGKRLTILSIDGGGVRGIIPARILAELQDYLEELDKNTEKHHLWEYFDIIAGTSSGGLITAMITTPSDNGSREPCFDAKKVVEFFKRDAVTIFPEKFTDKFHLRWLLEGFASVFGPLYSAEPLKNLLREKFRDKHLSDAFTSVIIPAFDTNNEVPVFFSDLKSVDDTKPLYNVLVRDACQATAAAPVFFPAVRFKEQVLGDQNEQALGDQNEQDLGDQNEQVLGDQKQSDRPKKEFNVIDGGIAVNDPTLVAVTQAIAQERHAIEEDEKAIKGQANEKELQIMMKKRSRDCTDFRDVLVLSLGTGQHPMRFLPKPHWSSAQWLLSPSGSPLLNSFLSASQDMVEYYTSMIFDAHQSGDNYLRIQTDSLSASEFWRIDEATNEKELEQTARALENGYVSKRNFATGKLEASTSGKLNKVALRSFAELLVEERRKSVVHSGNGEGSPSVKLPGKFGRTRRDSTAPSTSEAVQTAVDGCLAVQAVDGCSEVQTAVDGCRFMMRTAFGGCCLTMRAVILVLVCLAFCFYRLLQVLWWGAGDIWWGYLGSRRVGTHLD